MKRIFVLAALASVCILSSCKKFEEGPAFSFRSIKSRLHGEWKIESYSVNGTDQTSTFVSAQGANFMLEIEKDGTYRTEGNFADSGTWELGEDKDDIRFKSSGSSSEMSFRILRLTNKEFWAKQTQSNSDVWEYKYKAE
ncbi:MAG: hypothetical protein H6585_10310 [Flavobacteriales bacterium]|nr:hypothetical protein [Flavobacteriales bacterium]MCB9448724.1 hypothetical protein [Flavobacteriales bacterium]